MSIILIERMLIQYHSNHENEMPLKVLSFENIKYVIAVALLLVQKKYYDRYYCNHVVARQAGLDVNVLAKFES